jgi:hypothetical protein
LPLPQATRQVPRTIFQNPVLAASFRFGFELGSGLFTYVTTTLPYLVLVALLLLTPGYETALGVGAAFGLGRALTPVSRWFSGQGTSWDRRMDERTPLLAPLSLSAAIVGVGLMALFA